MLIYRKTAGFELQHVILRCSEFIASDIERGILLEMMDHGLCIESLVSEYSILWPGLLNDLVAGDDKVMF